ncbi:nucleoside-triphosphatase [Alkaliphilus hydrothermalis]|uniref:Uridine kinase n=1 Tax=Alkaliphilus hydrothermalis TaxID=1482730 RepID=A0ABS2NLG1_9FIRM|nr:uridine kinase [Alkaliphilus hydrothermalis]
MKNTRLIFIAGMSGAGKSTTTQRISNQLKNNNVKYIWLHCFKQMNEFLSK